MEFKVDKHFETWSLVLQGLYLEFENGCKNLTWSLEFSTRIVFGILKWMQDSKGQDPRCLCKSCHQLVPLAYKYVMRCNKINTIWFMSGK